MGILSFLLISLIKLYKRVSKFTFPKCRFYPSCSSYAIVAIMRYGFLKGVFLSIKRILKCNIFSKGGVDEVP